VIDEEISVDWEVLNVEGVEDVILQASRAMSRNVRYAHAVEIEDLQQEARILVATKEDLQECVYEGSLGLLHSRLVRDLINAVETDARRRDRVVSYDALMEGYSE